MADAGTVTIDFAAETAKFTAELKKVRGDLASIRAEAQRTNQMLSSFGSALKQIGSFVAIGALTRSIIKATQESEQAVALLDSAVQNAGMNVQDTSKDFQNFASQLQSLTTFNDEAILSVETLLLGFRGLSSGVIKQATADVLDLATRLKIDLDSAAKLVGRALQDPVKGLKLLNKAGLDFSGTQKEQIKTLVESGERVKAQQILLGELEARYKGAAEAARNNFGGAIAGVKNALDDLLEAKGGLPGATASMNELSRVLQDPATKAGADALFSLLIRGTAETTSLVGQTAAGLAVIFGKGGNEIVDLDIKIDRLRQSRERLLIGAHGDVKLLGPGAVLEIQRIDQELEKLLEKQRRLLKVGEFSGLEVTDAKAAREKAAKDAAAAEEAARALAAADAEAARQERIRLHNEEEEKKLQKTIEALSKSRDISFEINQAIADMTKERREQDGEEISAEADRRIERMLRLAEEEAGIAHWRANEEARIEEEKEAKLLAFRQAGFQAAQSLMTAFGGKYKKLATAILAIEKAQAIAKTIMDTKAAVMATLKHYGGTPWGYAAAAGVAVLGAAQVAAIASTVLGGGSSSPSLGAPHNPVFTDTAQTGDQPQFGAGSQSVVQVQINGNVFSSQETAEWIIAQIQDAVIDRDVVLINSNSRNALELQA